MFNNSKNGQSMVEYGMFLLLIALIAFVALNTFGSKLTSSLGKAKGQISSKSSEMAQPVAPSQTVYTLAPTAAITVGTPGKAVPGGTDGPKSSGGVGISN